MSADDLSRLQSYDDLTACIWHDKRCPPGTRELLLAMAWVLLRDQTRPAGADVWRTVGTLLGRDRIGRWRYRQLIAADAPRYEPPNTLHAAFCEAPRVRTVGVCGERASVNCHAVERDPRTGWCVDHWFCARHRDHYERVTAQIAAAPAAPEPIPNTGGLIGCYFACDLERLYRQRAPHWVPPTYGLCADDWPTPGVDVARSSRPRLRLIVGEMAEVDA